MGGRRLADQPGNRGFVEQCTDHVASALGSEAEYQFVPSGGLPDALEAVSKPGPEADKIAAADVVVVQVGSNNALPDPATGIGCKTWFLDAEPECPAEGVKTYGGLYDQVFAGVYLRQLDRIADQCVQAEANDLHAALGSGWRRPGACCCGQRHTGRERTRCAGKDADDARSELGRVSASDLRA